jgi:hypothetical protein
LKIAPYHAIVYPMTIEQKIDVPASRRITLEVPQEIPIGPVILTFTSTTEAAGECPECAKYRDPETGELHFNADTIAAFEEGDAMLREEKPAKWYASAEEMWADLDKDD